MISNDTCWRVSKVLTFISISVSASTSCTLNLWTWKWFLWRFSSSLLFPFWALNICSARTKAKFQLSSLVLSSSLTRSLLRHVTSPSSHRISLDSKIKKLRSFRRKSFGDWLGTRTSFFCRQFSRKFWISLSLAALLWSWSWTRIFGLDIPRNSW